MSAVEALRMAREIGVHVAVDRADLILHADQEPPAKLLDAIQRYKAGVIVLLAAADGSGSLDGSEVLRTEHPAIPESGPGARDQAWRDWFEERAAIREFEAGYTRAMAEHLAYGEAVNRWHRLHAGAPDPVRCAGCGEPVSNGETLVLPDGCCVHVDVHWRCLTAYGEKWRSAAMRGLAGLGIMPPLDGEST